MNQTIGQKNQEHVMISYNTASRDLCLKIKAGLELIGYKIWIDVNGKRNSFLLSFYSFLMFTFI
jgi:hypothetical protein